MKKILCIALMLAFTACAATSPQKETIKDEEYLVGVSLKKAGYSFEIKEDSELSLSPTETEEKANGKEPPSATSYVYSHLYKKPTPPYTAHNYLGEMHAILVRLKKAEYTTNNFSAVDVINFQLFEKSEFKEGKYARVLNASVPYDTLKNRVILELDEYVVIDVTDYMLADKAGVPVPPDEHLWQKWPNGHPDLEYALAIRDYILSNFDTFLTPIA